MNLLGEKTMDLDEITKLDNKYYMNTFGLRIHVSFVRGEGIILWDTNDKKYYDFLSGIAVNSLGHGHPKLVKAIQEQAEKLIHTSCLYYIENQAKLAQLLVDNSCADKIFFANSGAEANEGAIKLAKIYFSKQNKSHKHEIITLKDSFHGRTLATLAATGQEKYHEPYAPLMPSFVHVPINDFDTLINTISHATCAIMLELIQGESGVNPVEQEYLEKVSELCKKNDILLIFDEIQTGMGRTGKLFAYEHYGIEPDIFTLAKALGGGVPIGAVLAKESVASAFEPGDHGSTFGGNPLACAAGLAVMDALINDKLIENADAMGCYLISKLDMLQAKFKFIKEIRGKGLLIGIELCIDKSKEIRDKCFEKGYLIGIVGANILRIAPPLIVTKSDIDGLLIVLYRIFSEYVK